MLQDNLDRLFQRQNDSLEAPMFLFQCHKFQGGFHELILQDMGLTLRELPAFLLKNGFLFNDFPEYDLLLDYRPRPVQNGT